MPVDVYGRRADMVMDGVATLNRMNEGRVYEQYLNDVLDHALFKVCSILNVAKGTEGLDLSIVDENILTEAFNYLLDMFKLLSTKQYNFLSTIPRESIADYLSEVVEKGLFLWLPIDNDVDLRESIWNNIRGSVYEPVRHPVTYVTNSNIRVTTDNDIRISKLYCLVLDKTASEWNAISIGKIQHFGVLSVISKADKYRYPFRYTPVKTMGEDESRVIDSYTGMETIAEMMDRSNNPETMKNMAKNILENPQPTKIEKIIDRDEYKYGNTRILQLVKHVFFNAGFELVYEKEHR